MRRKITKRHNYLKLLAKLTLLVCIILSTLWLYKYLFIVRKINCTIVSQQQCEQAVLIELSNLNGATLINLSTKIVEDKILGAYPGIVKIDFTPKLPGILDVNIHKTKPLAKVAQSTQSAVLLIQDNGYIASFDPESNVGLPTIYYPDLNFTDQTVKVEDRTLTLLIDLVRTFGEYFIQIDNINIKDKSSAYIQLNLGPTAIFDIHSDLRKQIESLQLILGNTSSELPIKTIDVRLTKPIITTGESD